MDSRERTKHEAEKSRDETYFETIYGPENLKWTWSVKYTLLDYFLFDILERQLCTRAMPSSNLNEKYQLFEQIIENKRFLGRFHSGL